MIKRYIFIFTIQKFKYYKQCQNSTCTKTTSDFNVGKTSCNFNIDFKVETTSPQSRIFNVLLTSKSNKNSTLFQRCGTTFFVVGTWLINMPDWVIYISILMTFLLHALHLIFYYTTNYSLELHYKIDMWTFKDAQDQYIICL